MSGLVDEPNQTVLVQLLLHLHLCIQQMLLSKATYSAFRLYIFCQYMCSLGIEPTTFALLTQCSTTEPQEHSSPWSNQLFPRPNYSSHSPNSPSSKHCLSFHASLGCSVLFWTKPIQSAFLLCMAIYGKTWNYLLRLDSAISQWLVIKITIY